jgi:hypothetical protein
MDGWMDGWMGGWVDRLMIINNQSRAIEVAA